jgi:hypothetical protein
MLTRTLFVVIAKNYIEYLPVMGLLAFLPAIGFIYIYMTDSRQTGKEVFDDKIWWNDLRPIHGALYILFGILALQSDPNAWIVLLIDIIIGLFGFFYFHYNEGNISKLF